MEKDQKSELQCVILIVCPVVLIMLVWLTDTRWHDIKGSWLIDTNSLATTKGTITSSASFFRRGAKSSGWHYDIKYEFKLRDRTYRSNEVTFAGTGMGDRSLAESYVQRYPVGNTVTVYYEKGNPSFSVLEPNLKERGLITLPLGVALVSAAFLWAFLRAVIGSIIESVKIMRQSRQ